MRGHECPHTAGLREQQAQLPVSEHGREAEAPSFKPVLLVKPGKAREADQHFYREGELPDRPFLLQNEVLLEGAANHLQTGG